jgi:hypothetical protein
MRLLNTKLTRGMRRPVRSRGRLAEWLIGLTIVGASSTSAIAAAGDCGQPVSSGAKPVASDCLFILRTAVGSQTCDPACTCDVNGSGGKATASDALACLSTSVGVPGLLNCQCGGPQVDGDDFDDSAKDPTKWATDDVTGNGHLSEEADRVQSTCLSATDYDESYRPWIKSELPYESDWETQVDVRNLSDPTDADDVSSVGIEVRSPSTADDYLYAELYASSINGLPVRNGFYAELGFDQGNDYASADTGDLSLTSGAVRIAFAAATKVITVSWDYTGGTYDWTDYGTFSIDGSGGSDGNGNWGLSSGDRMSVLLYGYSANLKVLITDATYLDNFLMTGAVPPN